MFWFSVQQFNVVWLEIRVSGYKKNFPSQLLHIDITCNRSKLCSAVLCSAVQQHNCNQSSNRSVGLLHAIVHSSSSLVVENLSDSERFRIISSCRVRCSVFIVHAQTIRMLLNCFISKHNNNGRRQTNWYTFKFFRLWARIEYRKFEWCTVEWWMEQSGSKPQPANLYIIYSEKKCFNGKWNRMENGDREQEKKGGTTLNIILFWNDWSPQHVPNTLFTFI